MPLAVVVCWPCICWLDAKELILVGGKFVKWRGTHRFGPIPQSRASPVESPKMWGVIFCVLKSYFKWDWPSSTLKGFRSSRLLMWRIVWAWLVKLGLDQVRHWIWIRHWIWGSSTRFGEPAMVSPQWDAGWWAGVATTKGSTPTLRYVSQYLQEVKG